MMRVRCSASLPMLLALIVLPAAEAHAQSAAEKLLASARSLQCDFGVLSTGTWVDGAPKTEGKPAKLSFGFKDINTQEGTAEATSIWGDSYIIVRLSGRYLHFMQIMSEGPLYTTTVLAKESRAGRLIAVHTRHEYTDAIIPGFTSRPEQYIGDCEIGR